jgi:hypothetical protein
MEAKSRIMNKGALATQRTTKSKPAMKIACLTNMCAGGKMRLAAFGF